MSRLRANEITNRMANGAPTVSNGLVISGVSTHVGLSQFQNTINLTHASAGQNYIYFNEDLQFAKNGTGTRLKIASDGIVTSSATHPQIILKDSDSRQVSLRAPSTSNLAALGTDTNHDLLFYTNGYSNERLRINSSGALGVGGANYGSSGQVLTSQGSGSAIQWATPTSTSATATPSTGGGTVSGQRVASDLTYSSSANNTTVVLGNVSNCSTSSIYALEISLTYMHNGSTNHGYLTGYIFQTGKTYGLVGGYVSEQHYDWYYNYTMNRFIIPWDPSGTQSLSMYIQSAYNTNSGNKFYVDIANKLQNI